MENLTEVQSKMIKKWYDKDERKKERKKKKKKHSIQETKC